MKWRNLFQLTMITGKLLYQINRRAFLISILTGFIEALFYPLLLLVIWNAFSFVLQDKSPELLRRGLVIMIVLFLTLAAQQILGIINENAKSILRAESMQNINARMMDKMKGIPYPFFEANEFQAQYGLVLSEASYRPGQLVDALINTLISLVAFLSIILTLLVIAPLLVVLVIVSILLAAVETYFHSQTIDFQTSAAPELFRMEFLAQKSVDATWQRDIRVHRSSILQDEFRHLSQRYLTSLKRLLRRFQFIRIGVGLIASIFIALAIGVVFWLIVNNALSLTEAGILLPAIYLGLQQGRVMASSLGSLVECLLYIEKVFDFLNLSFEDGEEKLRLVLEDASKSATVQDMRIHLESVTFQYPDSAKVALSNISYTFQVGTTAIVGPNGAGKSTLVKLLIGLLSPSSGSINIYRPDEASFDPKKLYRAALFQEPSHLYLTIRQNITMKREKTANEDELIYQALEKVGLSRVVQELPDGIDTLVGAGFGGQTDLSGGQWQRLALARLLYHDAPVIILDEPVASLDPEGERAIFEIFSQYAQSKIIIFTTHRYDSVPKNTKIVVLVDGAISEVGTHDELLQLQHDYWSLYTATWKKS